MVEAVITPRLRLLLLFALLALPSAVVAHQLDEYLQSTLVAIDPAAIRLQIILTPGVSVAEQVLALMDRDADGVISTDESAAYADLLKRDLSLQLDTQDLPLKLTASDIPTPAELRTGAGIMQMEFTATPGTLAAGTHTLALQNRHFPSVSVYLFNAAKPKFATLQINQQTRNKNQSTGEIEFTFQPPMHAASAVGTMAAIGGVLVLVFVGGWRVLRKRREQETT
jgi:hypothetical protein